MGGRGQGDAERDPESEKAAAAVSVVWERFAGRTDSFAVRLAIMSDPHSGEGATPTESISWGSIQIWVHGQNLCAHADQGEMLTSVHWYLLPLLEWVAENWNPLLHEEKLPNRNSADSAADGLSVSRLAPSLGGEPEIESWEQEWFDWRSRHAIRSARSGGLLPNVVLRRLRDYVEVSWNSEQDAGAPRGFGFTASAGSALFYPVDVAEPLFDVVYAAAHFIRRFDQPLMDELLARLDLVSIPARQHDERLGWMAGLRPMSDMPDAGAGATALDTRWDLVVRSLGALGSFDASRAALDVDESSLVVIGSSQASLLFSSVSPSITPDDVRTLSAVLVDQYRERAETDALDDLMRREPIETGIPAWEDGYELAEDLHGELDLNLVEGWVDVEGLLRDMGVGLVERRLTDPDIRACSVIGPHHRPVVVHNLQSRFGTDNARRFTLAHELCHLLYDRSVGARVAIASGPWAPRRIERRANAFAAMFLMPEELIRSHASRMDVPIESSEGLSRLASALRVSRRAVIEHLYNMGMLSELDRDALLGYVVG